MESIFFIDVVTATIAIIILMILRIQAHEKLVRSEQAEGYFADLKKGFVYIGKHRFLKQFFFLMAMFLIMAAPVSFLTPLQVTRSFGDDVWRLTAIEIAFSIGMILGGLLIASWGGFRNRMNTIATGAITLRRMHDRPRFHSSLLDLYRHHGALRDLAADP